jgi:hypothetical protein
MENPLSKTSKITVFTLLIAEAVTVTIPVIILGKYFNFPDILRQPAENAFGLFRANQPSITFGYYIFLLSSLIYIPLSYAFKHLFDKTENKILMNVFVGLGITTTIFQAIGFIRWIFTMPYLTESYFSHPENKQMVTIIYETLNRYAGMSIGEHLGFIAMGSWTIILGLFIVLNTVTKKWIGYIGIAIGFLLLISVGEHFGGKNAELFGTINFLANTLWTFWLLVLALTIGYPKKNENNIR